MSINDGAKAHLGDSYHVRVDDPLRHLPYAKDAPFNAYSKQHEHDCHPGTRVDLLPEIYRWADKQDERRIFWLSGLAGTGKSTVARTVARSYYDKQRLGEGRRMGRMSEYTRGPPGFCCCRCFLPRWEASRFSI